MKSLFSRLLVISIFLTGCTSLLTSKSDVHLFYVLNPVGEVIDVQHPADIQLWVHDVNIPEWLDNQRIILRRGENQVDFYAEARWGMDAGEMIHKIVAQSLEANDVANNITLTRSSIAPNYQLDIEVVALQAEYPSTTSEKPPKVRVALQGKLIDSASGKVTYQFNVENITQAQKNNLTSIIKAFNNSMRECLTEVVKKTAKGLAVS